MKSSPISSLIGSPNSSEKMSEKKSVNDGLTTDYRHKYLEERRNNDGLSTQKSSQKMSRKSSQKMSEKSSEKQVVGINNESTVMKIKSAGYMAKSAGYFN
ncbi:MAG: hypothetical protein WC212_01935 [Candidatus Delongbacteria bacterium]|jgi:hypothetical protein